MLRSSPSLDVLRSLRQFQGCSGHRHRGSDGVRCLLSVPYHDREHSADGEEITRKDGVGKKGSTDSNGDFSNTTLVILTQRILI